MKFPAARSLKFAIPVVLWLILFWRFLVGRSTMGGETYYLYTPAKFFIDNLLSGHLALWNPFLFLGFPQQILLGYIGVLNPLWLVALILNLTGLPAATAFLCSLTLYYFAGMVGFYLLANAILSDKRAAFAAYLMMFFACPTSMIYLQFHPGLILIPSIWFFFFLFRFCQTWRPIFLFGLILSLSIVLTTYFPFYSLTVLLAVLSLILLTHPDHVPDWAQKAVVFIRAQYKTILLAGLVLLLACWVGYLNYRTTLRQEILAPFRQSQASLGAPTKNSLSIADYDYTDGAVSARMQLEDLYSNFDTMNLGNDGFFYITLFAYLLIFLGAINPMNRKNIALAGLTLFLTLLVLENTTPLHRWLFDHLPFFRMLRTITFFLPFLVGSVALLAAEHLRALLKQIDVAGFAQRIRLWLWVSTVHIGVFLFLRFQPSVPLYSFITIFASYGFFSGYLFLRAPLLKKIFLALLPLCILIHPAGLFAQYYQNTIDYGETCPGLKLPAQKPLFSFTRAPEQKYYPWFSLSMTDAPGSLAMGETFTAAWSYFLFSNISKDILNNFTQNKFYLYTQVRGVPQKLADFSELEEILRLKRNTAFVSLDLPQNMPPALQSFIAEDTEHLNAEPITKNSPLFTVTRFNAGSLTIATNYPEPKFLVYTDSFDPHWRAWRGKEPLPVYRVNMAFKGILLPAGSHTITLRYDPPGGSTPYWLGLLTLWGGTIALALRLSQERFLKKND